MRTAADRLDFGQETYRSAASSKSVSRYREQAVTNIGFVNGDKQWNAQEEYERAKLGKPTMTFNVLRGKVEFVASLETFARHNYMPKSVTRLPEHLEIERGIKYYCYNILSMLDVSRKDSLKFLDTSVTGLGVTNLILKTGNRDAGMTWKYEHVLPMLVIFDPSDMTMDFTDSRFVIRDRFLSASYCIARWPKLKKYFDKNRIFSLDTFDSHTAWMHMTAVYPGSNGQTGNIVQVTELQWKEYETCYYGTDVNGFAFETFDYDTAALTAASKREIKERVASRIYAMLFTGDDVLEYGPLEPSLPDRQDFTYIPCCLHRYDDGTPKAWMTDLLDMQTLINMNYSDALFARNKNSIIVSSNAIPKGKTPEDFRREANKKIGIHQITDQGIFKIENHAAEADGYINMVREIERQMSNVSNIYPHQFGFPNRVESGIALKEQKTQVAQNFASILEGHFKSKERFSRVLVDTLIHASDTNILCRFGGGEHADEVLLNSVRKVNGKTVTVNNLKTFSYTTVFEASPEYTSLREEDSDKLRAFFANPNDQTILFAQSPTLLREIGAVNNPETAQKIVDEILQAQIKMEEIRTQAVMRQQQNMAAAQAQAQGQEQGQDQSAPPPGGGP